MRFRAVFLFVLLLISCTPRSQVRQEWSEAELRTRERQNRELQENLEIAQNQNKALEAEFLRRQQIQAGQPKAQANDNSISVILKDITLGTGTTGIDKENQPGDVGFQVVIIPRDEDGSPIKVPGVAKIFASQITATGTRESLGAWQVDGVSLRKTWKTGLFSTGYYVPVYWQTPPTSTRIRITAQLLTLDGRTFEAEKEITIRLAPGP